MAVEVVFVRLVEISGAVRLLKGYMKIFTTVCQPIGVLRADFYPMTTKMKSIFCYTNVSRLSSLAVFLLIFQ